MDYYLLSFWEISGKNASRRKDKAHGLHPVTQLECLSERNYRLLRRWKTHVPG
jgi:hypothetical protein